MNIDELTKKLKKYQRKNFLFQGFVNSLKNSGDKKITNK